MDLFGLGEPLLDKDLPIKVKYAKSKGFVNVGFATNGHLLESDLTKKLMDAGLNTIILSIDGTTKEVHENIRRNTDFNKVVTNVKNAIAIRDKGSYKTKFVFRFIRQKSNIHQWDEFHEFWSKLVSKNKGDFIIGYNLHTWGGEIAVNENKKDNIPKNLPCHYIFDRMVILKDGTIPLCCADMHNANVTLGNVNDNTPIEIFNNEVITKIRKQHLDGNRLKMKICAECTILQSEEAQERDL
jgi:radical SAM protein with 4Fe4S-binding SPASM domain